MVGLLWCFFSHFRMLSLSEDYFFYLAEITLPLSEQLTFSEINVSLVVDNFGLDIESFLQYCSQRVHALRSLQSLQPPPRRIGLVMSCGFTSTDLVFPPP